MKIRPMGAELLHARGRMDGRTWQKLIIPNGELISVRKHDCKRMLDDGIYWQSK